MSNFRDPFAMRGAEDIRDLRSDRDHRNERDNRRAGTQVVLNAATGGAGPLRIKKMDSRITIVSVTLDADDIDDLSVLLNFTSIIVLPEESSVDLNFEVLRSKNGKEPIRIGPTFTFSEETEECESESFGFQVFDSDLEGGTFTYTVILTTNSVMERKMALEGMKEKSCGVSIINATLSALGVEKECR